jgi:rubrerythrin
MDEFETMLICFLVPYFAAVFYISGKGDLINLVILMLQEKQAEIEERLREAEVADAVEVVHGRWNMDKLEMGNPYDGNSTMLVDIGNCSVCGHRCEMLPIMNYCPNCGADMRGEADV